MSFYETFIQPIAQNQVVTGLSFTALVGAVGYQLRAIPTWIKRGLRRSTIVSLSVTNSDPAFTWIERWLAAQPYSGRARSVLLRSYDGDGDQACYSAAAVSWVLSPGEGLHWFWWKRRLVWLERQNDKPSSAGTTVRNQKQVVETIRLRTIGRSQATLRSLVEEACVAARAKDIVLVRLWRGYWASVRGKQPRALDTVVLARGQAERIVDALRRFEGAGAAYAKRGIPWRLGLLFKGPPGTGKTSFVLALAAHLNRPICVLNLGSVDNDDALFSAVMDAPADAIVLIEDIDCAASSRQRKPHAGSTPVANDDDEEENGVTKAGLLNALDGVTTPDGRIFVMTTNHPELLDPALVRPGRADIVEDFQYLDIEAQARMGALHYGPGRFVPLAKPQSPAAMQAAFMRWPDNPDAARRSLSDDGEQAEAA